MQDGSNSENVVHALIRALGRFRLSSLHRAGYPQKPMTYLTRSKLVLDNNNVNVNDAQR